MPGFQTPITIQQAIERIEKNQYLLPAFQREFVWSTEQIEKLFDSLMQGYPISSMLFWSVKGNTRTDFKFYQFLKKFVERHETHNDHIKADNLNDFHAVLDGQQRLTSLYIGLCGTYAFHLHNHSWAYSEKTFPTRTLYLNISSQYSHDDDTDMIYKFSFLLNSETEGKDLYIKEDEKWFRVGRILSLHKGKYDLDDFIEYNKLEKNPKKMLRKLDRIIHNESLINFYEEDSQDPDKAVNVFVRINSGGTYLSFSDILMSIAVANWKNKDARTEIFSLVDSVNRKDFKIDKDYILKAFLFLYHKDVRSKINSFNHGFIEKIEENWESIRDAILNVFDLMKTYGLTDYTLTTYNATLPILYYIYHKEIYKDFSKKVQFEQDRKLIKKWLFTILIRRTFGGQGDTVLTQARKAFTDDIENYKIQNITAFPQEGLMKEIKRISDVGDNYIDELLLTQKDTRYSFPILSLLYPNLDYKNNDFHQDHLHPAAKYDDLSDDIKTKYNWKTYNSILNLQMLDANLNMSKNDMPLIEWIETIVEKSELSNDADKNLYKKTFLKNQLIPNVDLKQENFSEFIETRKKILIENLKELIS